MRKINRRWTQEETLLLELWAGEVPTELIAKRLQRTKQSVTGKAVCMGIKLKPESNNFSLCTLARLIGCDHGAFSYWLKKGELIGRKTSKGRSGGTYRVKRENFKQFYLSHPRLSIFKGVDPDVIKYLIG
jgi:hypothetical protein